MVMIFIGPSFIVETSLIRYDEFLQWNPADFNGIRRLNLPSRLIWLPDIVLYNVGSTRHLVFSTSQAFFRTLQNADEFSSNNFMQANAMIIHNGSVFWPIPTRFKSTCQIDVTYFPYDEQECKLKFGSWTYNGFQVSIEERNDAIELSNYVPNGEWDLLDTSYQVNVVRYPCCPEPFPDITFYVRIRRRILYYLYSVVFPCVMLSILTLLVFCLPPESGEKIALGITVLLAFSVFMLAIAESMPETSEYIPLISKWTRDCRVLSLFRKHRFLFRLVSHSCHGNDKRFCYDDCLRPEPSLSWSEEEWNSVLASTVVEFVLGEHSASDWSTEESQKRRERQDN